MNSNEYNKLIYNNKLEELANIWNISDLTRYKYLNKYLLEYLLEKNIHTRMMDSLAIKDKLWIKLYLKYHIKEPLLNTSLEYLLVTDNNNKLLLDILLQKLNHDEKLILYSNIKKNSYWLYRINETQIIDIYHKYGINIPRIFTKLPIISNKDIKSNNKLNNLLNEFIKVFQNTDKVILDTYVNELKRNAIINRNQTYNDIKKLIDLKHDEPDFKLCLYEYYNDDEVSNGEYSSEDNRIVINQVNHGIFSHELSHLLYDQFEWEEYLKNNSKYKRIKKDIISDQVISNIISYLKDFHNRFNYMKTIFQELYFANIKTKYGNYTKYYNLIKKDLLNTNPEFIIIDNNDTSIFLSEDNIDEVVATLLAEEANLYVKIMINNYYTEELMLENLLDAILNGDIFEGVYDVDSLSGHSKESYDDEDDLSFNECLADFYSIINSPQANRLINKLRKIVGNRLVNFLENYVAKNRDYKEKILRK